MKKFLKNEIVQIIAVLTMVILALSFFPEEAKSGTRCTKDYFGTWTCTGNGQTWRGTKDYFGNRNWRSNDGQTYRCRTDYFDNVICD